MNRANLVEMSVPIQISRILHAGYVFECDGAEIAFDPIFENPFSRNCHAFPDVEFDREQIKRLRFDAVFISHLHDDHLSLESLDLLDRRTPIYLYCVFEELFSMIGDLGFNSVSRLRLDAPVMIGSFEVIPRPALDVDTDSIFQISAAGLNVLNVVDSWIDPETLAEFVRRGPWDLVLWPFQTMRELELLSPRRAPTQAAELPHEWIEQLKAIQPTYVVPSSCQFIFESWSWYNRAFFPISYAQFKEQVESAIPGSDVIRLAPSHSIILDKSSWSAAPPLRWIRIVGDPQVDYDYDRDYPAPSTAEIARHFPALDDVQTQTVLNYCTTGLIEKYNSLEPPADPYFLKPRVWRLSLYDHDGQAIVFYYRLQNGKMARMTDAAPFAWCTEVPLSRLLSALVDGESLTSMYVRINDVVFEKDVECEIASADILEDPLISCLFTGVIGGYQRAQLRRLKDAVAKSS